MDTVSRYPVPAQARRVEQTVRRSRFITTLARAASPDDAAAFVGRVSEEFDDATHNCWAFVAGPPGSTAAVGMSDDGEPHGTAGRPMLDVLIHSGVGEIAAVVTRYYGGVKLGKGGLGRAYSGSVQLALEGLPLKCCRGKAGRKGTALALILKSSYWRQVTALLLLTHAPWWHAFHFEDR